MSNPTPDVSSKYGAPMGRHVHPGDIDLDAKLYLRRARLDNGGYDAGGAYWGYPDNLWAWGDGESWDFVRAASRDYAKAILRELHGELTFIR